MSNLRFLLQLRTYSVSISQCRTRCICSYFGFLWMKQRSFLALHARISRSFIHRSHLRHYLWTTTKVTPSSTDSSGTSWYFTNSLEWDILEGNRISVLIVRFWFVTNNFSYLLLVESLLLRGIISWYELLSENNVMAIQLPKCISYFPKLKCFSNNV